MRKLTVVLLMIGSLLCPAGVIADECMEGDCENGFGTGFTDDNRIYEGEWKDGQPHGRGKLFESREKVIEGIWEKGKIVREESGKKVNEETTGSEGK